MGYEQITDKARHYVVSWRAGPGGTREWVGDLIDFMGVEHGTLPTDTEAAGFDRRSLRPPETSAERSLDYSDFICVLTLEYYKACKAPDHELHWVRKQLGSADASLRGWALRLDGTDIDRAIVPLGDTQLRPWREPHWHLLPPRGREPFDAGAAADDRRKVIPQDCVVPLRHEHHCDLCTSAPREKTSWFSRLRQHFTRQGND